MSEQSFPVYGERPPSWRVLVEYSNNGQAKPPTLVDELTEYGDRSEALAQAHRMALTWDPPDPLAPRGRRVYRTDENRYLVVVDGALSVFHFTVTVAEVVPVE